MNDEDRYASALKIPLAVAAAMGLRTEARVVVDGKEHQVAYVEADDRIIVVTDYGSRAVTARPSMAPAELAQVVAVQLIKQGMAEA
jgi:hypothetical protein